MHQLPPKKPYVAPRVLKVQRRISGDNLASGCKVGTEFSQGGGIGPNMNSCLINGGACRDVGS
jgi:hypothetical protein